MGKMWGTVPHSRHPSYVCLYHDLLMIFFSYILNNSKPFHEVCQLSLISPLENVSSLQSRWQSYLNVMLFIVSWVSFITQTFGVKGVCGLGNQIILVDHAGRALGLALLDCWGKKTWFPLRLKAGVWDGKPYCFMDYIGIIPLLVVLWLFVYKVLVLWPIWERHWGSTR